MRKDRPLPILVSAILGTKPRTRPLVNTFTYPEQDEHTPKKKPKALRGR